MAISSKEIKEGVKKGISVVQFFESNGVPYHVFEKWYKKKFTQPTVVDCVVKGTLDVVPQPSTENKVEGTDSTAGHGLCVYFQRPETCQDYPS